MNPDVQKVLDFIREGAKAASGPAKWGFEQVCAYQASQAVAYLIGLLAALVLSVAALSVSIYYKRNPSKVKKVYEGNYFGCPSKFNSQWDIRTVEGANEIKRFEWVEEQANHWAETGITISVGACIVSILLLVMFAAPLYATIHNPAGAVLDSLTNH